MRLSPQQMLEYLKGKGCKIGGVTQGERGLYWYNERGDVSLLPALPVPKEKIIDTSGAGDIFHGAYVASYLAAPEKASQRISVSAVPPRPTRSHVLATKPDCRRRPMSLRLYRNMLHSVFERSGFGSREENASNKNPRVSILTPSEPSFRPDRRRRPWSSARPCRRLSPARARAKYSSGVRSPRSHRAHPAD